jgi:CubicO group peptidase (beta-lactamase class C family)
MMPDRFPQLAMAAVVSALLGASQPLPARDPHSGPADPKEVEEFIDRFFHEKMAERHIPGAVFVLVRDGQITFAKGFGYADLEKRIPVVPDKTVFLTASVSKLFTATAVMQLVERGRLKLDEDVNHYLQAFQLRQPFARPVTLADLLTHTGGFDDRTIGTLADNRSEVVPLGSYLATQMPACALPPGDVINYSDHGNSLAGYLVEERSGVPFARYIDENILAPLGMRHSSFDPGPELEHDLAVGYSYDKANDRFAPIRRRYPNAAPAGSLVATGTDMAAFLIAHLQDGRYRAAQVLEPATARDMHRQHFTQHPRLPGLAYGFFECFRNGRRALQHSGDLGGCASLFFLLTDEGTGFFVSYNRDDFKLRDDLAKAFLDHYYPAANSASFPTPPADFARRAALFTGNYRYNHYSRNTLEKPVSLLQVRVTDRGDGTLAIEIPSALHDVLKPIRLVEVEPLLFRRDDGDNYAAFRMDADGRISHLALNVLGLAVVLEKVPWFETTAVQAPLGIGFLTNFLAGCLVWPLGAFIRRWRGTPPDPAMPRFTPWLAFLIGLLNLAFTAGLAAVVYYSDIEKDVPPALVAVLVLPLVSAVLTIGLVVCTLLVWKRGSSPLLKRYFLYVVTLASVGFLLFLDFWKLFGFRY